MALKSVQEDLQARTLHAVTGLLGKLAYFASLRQDDGSYMHWGLSRVHGDGAAQGALAEAHRNLVSLILRTPLRKLLQDVDETSESRSIASGAFLAELQSGEGQTLPGDPSAGYRRHLNSVLRALSALTRTRL